MKAQHFHTILPCQKQMLRQIEWGVQNGPIKKNGPLLLFHVFKNLTGVQEPLTSS